jgi:hypothetical protein
VLTEEEKGLCSELKIKCLGLASLARTIARQCSRISFLSDGDANTIFFHLQASHRGHKNHIDQLSHQGVVIVEEQLKAHAVFQHFDVILGTPEDWLFSLDFSRLGIPTVDLSSLDPCFSEEEVWAVIRALLPDKAPGPDSFTWCFYQYAWSIIKRDILQSLTSLWSLHGRNFYLLNQAYMILLCKKQNVEEVMDFMPISLIHSFSKMFAKLLSTRLAPHMSTLVLPNHSAFIQGRAIHDNFRAVHCAAKLLHAR